MCGKNSKKYRVFTGNSQLIVIHLCTNNAQKHYIESSYFHPIQKLIMKKVVWILLIVGFAQARIFAQQDSTMFAHYINVGQAASVLLEFPCGAMLIDAGAQDKDYEKKLLNYLTKFFERRTDLNKTLALVMVTHPHIDHNEALDTVARAFRVDRYIDDGLRVGSGKANQRWMEDAAAKSGIKYEHFSSENITKNNNQRGITDSVIDPINCKNGNPAITLYSGNYDVKPDDWTKTDYENHNNHSLVIKIEFGKASFLFTGDLETKGIETLLQEYKGTKALDVDVLMVAHHGAANATTDDFLNAVTPKYAVISCGPSDFGANSSDKFTTYAYGHPRVSTINKLASHISQTRTTPIRVQAAEGSRQFRPIDIVKRIYATPWDNNIVIRATTAGAYRVITDN